MSLSSKIKAMKKAILLALLAVVVYVGGCLLSQQIYRFPTFEEMENYAENKSLGMSKAFEVQEIEAGKFRVINPRPRAGEGKSFVVDAPKRWVLPWENYPWQQRK